MLRDGRFPEIFDKYRFLLFYGPEPFDIEWSSVDIDSPDFAFAFLYAISNFDGMCKVLRIIFGVFAINENQSFLSVIFKCFDFMYEFFVGEGFPDLFFICSSKAAIETVVGAFIAYI